MTRSLWIAAAFATATVPSIAEASPGICIAYDVIQKRSIISKTFDFTTDVGMPKTKEEAAWRDWLTRNYDGKIGDNNTQCESYTSPIRLSERRKFFEDGKSAFGPYFPVNYP